MSQIIEELIKDIGPVRFSILSDKKIQLEYKVPIISNGVVIETIKMKFRYRKSDENWLSIPIRERFINQLSVRYGIKKKNIKLDYHEIGNKIHSMSHYYYKFCVDGIDYNISSLFKSFIFDDIVWHRERLLNILINQ